MFWWELRPCSYYAAFDKPKVLWPDIAKLPRFSWDEEGCLANNKCYFIAECPRWLHALLQSRILWFCTSQICTPLRLRGGLWQYQPFMQFIVRLPVPSVDDDAKAALADLAGEAFEVARSRYRLHAQVCHRILTDLDDGTHGLNQKLSIWYDIDFRTFWSEVRKTLRADTSPTDRSDWEDALAGWQSDHKRLTSHLIEVEAAIDDRVGHLFALSTKDRQLLDAHMRQAQILFPFGEV